MIQMRAIKRRLCWFFTAHTPCRGGVEYGCGERAGDLNFLFRSCWCGFHCEEVQRVEVREESPT